MSYQASKFPQQHTNPAFSAFISLMPAFSFFYFDSESQQIHLKVNQVSFMLIQLKVSRLIKLSD